ncbi:MAG: hypothetical protein KDA61_11870 [Planctomycetales bacterium]|nr:hypothetical protein [Planctomycetales bacterium]
MAMQTPDFPARSESPALLRIGVVSLLVLACAYPFALNLVDPDLWGHVKYGRDWIADGQLPHTATHTYTAPDHVWINHENAAELLFAVGFRYVPVHVMLVFKCLWGLSLLGLMAVAARRRGVPLLPTWVFLLLIAYNLQAFFPMRPQLLSFALFSCALYCLDRGFPEWPEGRVIRYRWLLSLPLIFAAWANSHGAFVAGLGIVGAVLAGRMVETLVAEGRQGLSTALAIGGIGLATAAATFLNPYGADLHVWLAGSLSHPRPEITEWRPPSYGKPVFWPLVALLSVSVATWVATPRRRDWTQIIVSALVAWQACLHLRHISLLALTAGFWLAPHAYSAVARLAERRARRESIAPPWWFRFAAASAILVGIVAQSISLSERLSDFPVYRDKFPVDALQFMVDHRMKGKLVAAFNWSQYAISALAPHVTVGFDGRFRTCYPQEVVDMHFDFFLGDFNGKRYRSPNSGPINPRKVLEFNSPDLVLVDRRYRTSAAVMQEEASQPHPKWTLLYSDPVALLYGRSSIYDDPHHPEFFPPEDRAVDVRLLMATFQWPALPDYSLWDELEAAERVESSASDKARPSPTSTSTQSSSVGRSLVPPHAQLHRSRS